MKQCLIVKSGTTLATGDAYDLTTLAKGQIGFFGLDDSKYVSDAALSKDFGIAVGGGENVRAFVVPEVDFNSLSVAKSGPQEAKAKVVTFTFPTPEVKGEYTIIISKKGLKFNERVNWTSDVIATTTTAATEAAKLVAAINANNSVHNVTASASGATITLTGAENQDFEVNLADKLEGVEVTVSTKFVPSANLKADIQELALACAAGKSVNYLAEDGKELYPNFPVEVDSDKYVVYTLRFAVGRAAAKQRDEKVTQTVHIAVPSDSAIVTSLDTLFGVA